MTARSIVTLQDGHGVEAPPALQLGSCGTLRAGTPKWRGYRGVVKVLYSNGRVVVGDLTALLQYSGP